MQSYETIEDDYPEFARDDIPTITTNQEPSLAQDFFHAPLAQAQQLPALMKAHILTALLVWVICFLIWHYTTLFNPRVEGGLWWWLFPIFFFATTLTIHNYYSSGELWKGALATLGVICIALFVINILTIQAPIPDPMPITPIPAPGSPPSPPAPLPIPALPGFAVNATYWFMWPCGIIIVIMVAIYQFKINEEPSWVALIVNEFAIINILTFFQWIFFFPNIYPFFVIIFFVTLIPVAGIYMRYELGEQRPLIYGVALIVILNFLLFFALFVARIAHWYFIALIPSGVLVWFLLKKAGEENYFVVTDESVSQQYQTQPGGDQSYQSGYQSGYQTGGSTGIYPDSSTPPYQPQAYQDAYSPADPYNPQVAAEQI